MFIVILCASHILFQIFNLSLIKALISSWCRLRNKVSTPAISDFPNTLACILSHAVSCFHAHLEGCPGCLNSLNKITCGTLGVWRPPRPHLEVTTHATFNYQSPTPPKNPSIFPYAICQWPQLISLRSPEDHLNQEKDIVQETEASIYMHAALPESLCPEDVWMWKYPQDLTCKPISFYWKGPSRARRTQNAGLQKHRPEEFTMGLKMVRCRYILTAKPRTTWS